MRYTNHLINESSPYLLQHARNPVDWYPWCDEAFKKAENEDKPIFLSIGYSTCHWCHVMERESFEDEAVAAILNKHFISIKVDREERPDIDAVYMNVCQAVTGSGGWPLTVFLTAEQKAFYVGTYFPKNQRYGMPGLIDVLNSIHIAWNSDRKALLTSSEKIIDALSHEKSSVTKMPDKTPILLAATQLEDSFDSRYGGFGAAPKFPSPHNLIFLMRCYLLGLGDNMLSMAEQTLKAMYQGGIFDHIEGGFSRYSTDESWLIPHFEKMLYDNALLTMAYSEAYQITKNELYWGIVKKTLAYIQHEMTSCMGGFYCAQDADSNGEEGKYYSFTKSEILDVLGVDEGEKFCKLYDITDRGNFEGKNISNLIKNGAWLPDAEMEADLKKLYEYRKKRYNLHKDDKILTSWNALMIAAYAKAYCVFGEAEYLEAAQRAFDFLVKNLYTEDGCLLVSFRNGKVGSSGLLDDYAFLSFACLELYNSTFEADYLKRACDLMDKLIVDFKSENGGFYLSGKNGENLVLKTREQYDGAIPSGNSVAAWCLVRLSALTGEEKWQTAAEEQLKFYGGFFAKQPTAATFALLALMQETYDRQELICITADEKAKKQLAIELEKKPHPQTAVLVKSPADQKNLADIAEFVSDYPIPEQGEMYYLCQNRQCSSPTPDLHNILDSSCFYKKQ